MKTSVLDDFKFIRDRLDEIQKERDNSPKAQESTVPQDDPGDSQDYLDYCCGLYEVIFT